MSKTSDKLKSPLLNTIIYKPFLADATLIGLHFAFYGISGIVEISVNRS